MRKRIDHKGRTIFSNINVSENYVQQKQSWEEQFLLKHMSRVNSSSPNVAACKNTNPNTGNIGQFVLLSQISSLDFMVTTRSFQVCVLCFHVCIWNAAYADTLKPLKVRLKLNKYYLLVWENIIISWSPVITSTHWRQCPLPESCWETACI